MPSPGIFALVAELGRHGPKDIKVFAPCILPGILCCAANATAAVATFSQ